MSHLTQALRLTIVHTLDLITGVLGSIADTVAEWEWEARR